MEASRRRFALLSRRVTYDYVLVLPDGSRLIVVIPDITRATGTSTSAS